MTRRIALIQLGVGSIGSAVARLLISQAERWRDDYGLHLGHYALADSSGFVPFAAESATSTLVTQQREAIERALAWRANGAPLALLKGAAPSAAWSQALGDALAAATTPQDVVVLDCASGAGTTPLLLAAREAGAHVALANKDPLTGSLAQFRALRGAGQPGSLRLSATVGAGLPIAATIAALMASGDTLLDVRARASGSLGFLCDALAQGFPFDEAVRLAGERGYTEPDPRQDLSGFDVARKLLILARLAGSTAELSDVQVENLTPAALTALPLEEFRQRLPAHAAHLSDRVREAQASGRLLRYVGRIDPSGAPSAGLAAVALDDPLGRGQGPDNVFVLRTQRYDTHPLTVMGPGAGVAVTSGAVVADTLRALGAV